MIGDGIPYPDIARIRSELTSWRMWFGLWRELALEYEREAEQALVLGCPISAGELYWHASLSWHYAQFLWFEFREERESGQKSKVEMYRKAAPLLSPSAERVEVPCEAFPIPGYLRLPVNESVAPCVVLIGGLESTKEESYGFENMCLRRGIATFTFDGPGQGEYFFQRPMVADFERYTSAVIDYLQNRPEIDRNRIGVLGRSLGGYYAVRSAALDDRLKACVAFGALYDLSFFRDLEPLTQEGFRYATGIPDSTEAEVALRRYVNLAGVAKQLRAPLYVLHGGKDRLIPPTQAALLDRNVTHAPKTIVIEPEGDHCCHNLHSRVRPKMADWLAIQLKASGYRRQT
jgi:2,6-dihydroxypseudooxynicotine hydrolase